MKEEHIQNLISLKRSLENDIQGMEYTLEVRKTEVKFLTELLKEHEKGFDIVHTRRTKRLGEPKSKLFFTKIDYLIDTFKSFLLSCTCVIRHMMHLLTSISDYT